MVNPPPAGAVPSWFQTPEVQQSMMSGASSGRALAQGYSGPLSQQLQFQPGTTQIDPQSLALMQAYFQGLTHHPLEIGTQTPHLQSPIFNQVADGQAHAISLAADAPRIAQGIYQNTIGAFINQAKDNPMLAVGEVLGTVGLFAAAGALDVATGGLATPLLWTGFAMFAAPTLLPMLTEGIQNAIANPTDASITQLLVGVGTAAITLGSPVKAFKGIGATRSILAQQARSVAILHQPGQAVNLLMRDKLGKEAPYLLPEDRFGVIPQTADEWEQEVATRKAKGEMLTSADEDLITKYGTGLKEHDMLAHQISTLEMGFQDVQEGKVQPREAGKFRSRQDYLNEVSQKLQERRPNIQDSEQVLIGLQMQVAHRYGYVLARENPLGRIQKDELSKIDPAAADKANKAFRSVWGVLHYSGEGHGWNGAPDGVVHSEFAANLSESMAREDAAGGLGHAQRILQTEFMNGAKALGISAERMDAIHAAIDGHKDPMEDQKLWNSLSPHEKLMAEKVHITYGIITNYAYKHGHIEMPMHRYVPRMVIHDDPAVGRGTRSTQAMMEALTPTARAVQNRSWGLKSSGDMTTDWEMANELQDAEHDPEEGMGTISERLEQRHKPWNDFNKEESNKRANYTEYAPMREALKDTKPHDINGEQKTTNQFLLEKRREHGSLIRGRNLMQKRIDETPGKLGDLVRNVNENKKTLEDLTRQREQLKGVRTAGPQRAQLDTKLKDLRNQIRKDQTAHKNLAGNVKDWENKLAEYTKKAENMPGVWAKQAGVSHIPNAESWFNVEAMDRDALKSRLSAQPGGRRLLSGFDLHRLGFGRYLRQMNQAAYRPAWEGISYTPAGEAMKMAYGAKEGLSLAELSLKDTNDQPVSLNSNIQLGERNTDAHQALYDAGYEMVMPAMGRSGQLNYKPAIFGRKDVVGKYREMAQNARSSADFQSAFARSVYDVSVGIPKRLIMGSPAWHGKNVTGRALAVLLQNPGTAGIALFNVLKNRMMDPEAYYMTKLEHWQNGGVPANKFNITDHLNWLEQEMSGQRNFGYAMRHPLGALAHAHAQAAEGWFWKTVDDVGTMAYLTQKHSLQTTKPWMTEGMSGMLAAEYANNVSGMVNPLYMSKLWRWGRQMIFFAPAWWTTFYRTVGQSMPGMSRLSGLMNKSGRFKSFDPIKMHSLDLRHRKEMVRMHRSYFTNMMAAALVTHDMMNYMFSGHHAWENGSGHEWDVEMDKIQPPKQDLKTGQTQHSRMHNIQLFSQMADLLNGMGVGHDWGFMHTMTTDSFKKADGMHKMSMLGASLDQGINNEAAGKLSTAVNLGMGVGAGIDPYSLLRDHQVQEIPRQEALLGALPGGYVAQRQIDQYRRAVERAAITGDQSAVQQEQSKILPTTVSAVASQFVGFPSLLYSGDEPMNGYHFLTEKESLKYMQERQNILTTKKTISDKMLQGGISPNDWVTQNEMQTQRYLQLLSDTYGDNSSGKSLFDARRQLYTKYHLDDPAISRQQKEYNLQQFEQDWQDQLTHSSPEVKSLWWETHTSMWTDADYLYWLSSQMRQAVASHIDGQGGRHIQEAQRRLGTQGLPLTPQATDALRQQDPQLWTYQQVMSSLGKNTLLGALTSAYHDPFANFNVFPDDQGPAIQAADAAGVLKGGSTFVPASEMEAMGQAAKGVGGEAAPEAGEIAQTPGAQQAAAGLSAESAQQILSANEALNPNSVKRLGPDAIAWLQRIAQGGNLQQ